MNLTCWHRLFYMILFAMIRKKNQSLVYHRVLVKKNLLWKCGQKENNFVSIISFLGCVNIPTPEHLYIEYVQPEDLFEFYDLTFNLTVKSHHTEVVNHTIVQRVHELYTNITNRFDETKKWCVNALGIAGQVCVCVWLRLCLCFLQKRVNIWQLSFFLVIFFPLSLYPVREI